ncbi:MAG: hypothetical protein QOJ32_1098 [Frankiaceae bacterium]|jgi:hypothetical protein|nr:hypothetical protein [Frankiaceae bacterium]MDQ1648460.1 hypothetical protein [Frankiaceae bacterium]MDQ1672414.1 hypothetical protein [Frankiaceae bacterium]
MDLGRLSALAAELRRCSWWDDARHLGGSVRQSTERTSDLLVVGTPDAEPWHLVAHLADAARFGSGLAATPTLLRWRVPPTAPAHLAVGVERLADVRRSTLLVVAPAAAPAGLLQRISDARNRGATILSVAGDDGSVAASDLAGLTHDQVLLPTPDEVELDLAGHVVGAAAASALLPAQNRRRGLFRVAS